MKITPESIGLPYTQTELDQRLNELLVGLDDFSYIACTDGRLSGVITPCDACGHEFNECVRQHLIDKLLSVHEIVERRLGFSLTPRYHTETHTWNGRTRLQTNFPGVAAFAVQQSIVSVSGTAVFAVSPYIIEDAPLVDSGEGYCYVQLDRELVDNPKHVILRDGSGAIVEPDDSRFGFPRRTATHWELALYPEVYEPPCATGSINVQHCNLVAVETTLYTPTSGTVFPVYEGTQQIIPQARPSQIIDNGEDPDTVRYWFYVWDLLDSAFFSEGMNWTNGEFYKLVDNIELKIFTEAPAEITVKYYDRCCGETRYATTEWEAFEVVDPKYGIIELFRNATPCSCDCLDDCQDVVEVTFSYRTDPSFFADDYLGTIREAIAWLVAAELPLQVCDCPPMKTGYIAMAQRPYEKTSVSSFSGTVVVNLDPDMLYGQVEYRKQIGRVKHFQRIVQT
jgi:hypothetical protein